MNSSAYRWLLHYGIAIAATAIAILLRYQLDPLLFGGLGSFSYIAVIVSTWYGGLRPGIVATILSALAINYFFTPPIHQFGLQQPIDIVRLVVFLLVSLTIAAFGGNLQTSQRKIEKLSQQLLAESSDRLQTALSAAQMGMWDWNMVSGEITWSPEHEQLLGLPPGSFDGRYETFDACLYPDDRAGLNQAIAHSLQNRVPYQHEFRVVWADGSIHWVEGRGKAFYGDDGQPVRMTGTILAIDARKQAQLLLTQQFEQQRLVMEMTNRIRRSPNLQEILQTTVDEVRQFLQVDRVIIFQFTPDWGGTIVIESVVDDAFALFPLEIHDPCIGDRYVEPFLQGLVTAKDDIYTAEINPCHVEFLAQLQVRANLVVPILKNGGLWGLLVAHHCVAPRHWQDSEIDLLRQVAAQVSIALQQAMLFEQIHIELLERQQAELALQESEKQLQLFIRYAPASIVMFDHEMRYLAASQRWLDDFQVGSVTSIIGRSHYDLFPNLPEHLKQSHQRGLAGAIEKCDEDVFIHADGTQEWFRWEVHPWHKLNGNLGGIILFSENITERKQAEAELRKRERLFSTLAEALPVTIFRFDATSHCRYLNSYWTVMTGRSLEAAMGFGWLETLHPDDRDRLTQEWLEWSQNAPQRGCYTNEGRLIHQHGGEIPYYIQALPEVDTNGTVIGYIGVLVDITQKKQSEIALQKLNTELEQRVNDRTAELTTVNDRLLETLMEQQHTQLLLLEQAQLLDLAHDTIMTLDLNWVITFWNQGAEETYGWSKHEALGQESYALLQTQFPQPLEEIQAAVFEQGYWEGELVHFNRDDCPLTVASRWVLQKDPMGRPIKILEINNDITARKQAELALKESEERRRLALDLTHIGFWDMQLPNGAIIWNDNHFTLLGLPPYACQPSYELWRTQVHPDDLEWVESSFMASIEQHTDYAAEYRVIYPDGSIHWLMGRARALYDDAGQPTRSLGVLLDITDRKQAEEMLALQSVIVRNMAEGICLVKANDASIVYANPKFEQMFGYAPGELNGQHVAILNYPSESVTAEAVYQSIRAAVLQNREFTYDVHNIKKDGTPFWCRATCSVFKHPEYGDVLVAVQQDITERRKLDQMKQEFISVVSHELRTPLTSIRGSLGLIAGGVYDKKPEKMKEMIAIAARQSDRLVRLVNDILNLRRLESGQSKFKLQHYSAADLIQQSVDVMRAQAEENQVTLSILPTTVAVWADADAIVQTLTNLLSNAIKFSPPHSTVTITATSTHSPTHTLFSVQDQGRGIPPEHLETIFGQFQQVDASDSREKGGTGLGLAICRTIVKQHGGRIWVESVLEQGSTFYFTLPSAQPSADNN